MTCRASASAPGKLILFGEHAVVYGTTAIAGALSDLRIHVEASTNDSGLVAITFPGFSGGEATRMAVPVSSLLPLLSSPSLDPLPPTGAAGSAASSPADSEGAGAAASPRPSHLLARPRRPDPAFVAELEAVLAAACGETSGPQERKAALAPLFLACGIFRLSLSPCRGSDAQRGVAGAAAAGESSSATLTECLGVEIAVTASTLPVAAGLGSSAALSVAAAAAILDCWCRHASGGGRSLRAVTSVDTAADGSAAAAASSLPGGAPLPLPLPQAALECVNAWAYASECLFHGSPSGLDNTVSCLGGLLQYARPPGSAAIAVRPVAGLPPLRLLVVNTRVPKETGALVAGVRRLHDAHPAVVRPVIAAIQAIAEEVLALVAARRSGAGAGAGGGPEGDGASAGPSSPATAPSPLTPPEYAALARLVKINHGLLNGLGVGHAALDDVVHAAARRGFACKLTGAGGGGCALVLLPSSFSDSSGAGAGSAAAAAAAAGAGGASLTAAEVAAAVESLEAELKSKGCDVFETAVGGQGLVLV